MTATNDIDDIIDDARHALRAFGKLDRATARTLLAMWGRADQLTPEQREDILSGFPVSTGRAVR